MTHDPLLHDLLDFIGASPTPFHAVASATARLGAAGFKAIAETDSWAELSPGRYVFAHGGSSLFAFVVPESARISGFRLVGAHTDSPNLRLKPNAEYKKEGYAQLGVEVYGGVLLNSWLDRDLSLAGRVFVREGDHIETRLVRFTKPMLRVAQLAIHLDRDVNEGLKLNRQDHLPPIFGLADGGKELPALLAEELKTTRDKIVGSDLMLYDVVSPTLGGRDEELIFSARLDNLAMCHAGVRALIDAAPRVEASDIVAVVALFDHEEVGSESAYGAHSGFLPRALERIVSGRGGSREDYHRALGGSLCVSADMAHAVHPNYESRHEARHKPVLNGGPVIKVNAQQRYATSGPTAILFRDLCTKAEVPVQHYAHRTDLPCGSTIGPIASTLLGIRTVDVGNPMLSMHSIRELGGSKDPAMMTKVLDAFYACPIQASYDRESIEKDAVVLAFALTSLLLTAACGGKKVGSSCKGSESTCFDKKTALACRAGTYAEVSCAGPLGCSKYQDHANCDTSVASAGQACLGEDEEYACSTDAKHAVVCKAGKFDPWLECRGKAGCSMLGRTLSCDNSVAEKGDPCKTQGATACSVDQKQMLTCLDGKFATYRYCRGQYGCSIKEETPACDETISLAGDPCGIPGRVVCSVDGKTELVCQGGAYTKSLTCKTACTVTNRAGRPIDCQ